MNSESYENSKKILGAYFSGELPEELADRIREWYAKNAERPDQDEAMRTLFDEIVGTGRKPSLAVYRKCVEIKRMLGLPDPQMPAELAEENRRKYK